jgi:hypothetical protein
MNESIDAPQHDVREVPRYTLIATAEFRDPLSGVRIAGRISEISRKGCYLDVLNTLPKDTHIEVRISRDRGNFAAAGKIVYEQERMGMGVAFCDVPADQLAILDSWLAELTGSSSQV